MKRLYVGNLSFQTTDQELREAFAPFGEVVSVAVMMDRYSGRPRGFGFVEMRDDAEAQAAIEGMNGKVLAGRQLVVNEARPMEKRRGGGPRGAYGERSWGQGRGGGYRGGPGGRAGGGQPGEYAERERGGAGRGDRHNHDRRGDRHANW
ncbi:MAG TPA: RNA-binding protein [Phycisphaerae bacterium]|jgi:RNA recognition motif-containing protein|nr:RNA-binding protein [Phycisphaerae bacterium]HQA45681.1 RNA-binding protein [Phycisphaerae bacterium]